MKNNRFEVGKLYTVKKDSWYYQDSLSVKSHERERGIQALYTDDEEIIRKGFPNAKSAGRSMSINLNESPILILATNYDSTGDTDFCKILTGEHVGWTYLHRSDVGIECFIELKAGNEE